MDCSSDTGFGLDACSENGTEDVCIPCKEGFVQRLNVSSLDMKNTACFKEFKRKHKGCPLDDFHTVEIGRYSDQLPFSCECALEKCHWPEAGYKSAGSCKTENTCQAHHQLSKLTGECERCPWYAYKDQPGCWPCVINVTLLRWGNPDCEQVSISQASKSDGNGLIIIIVPLVSVLGSVILIACFCYFCRRGKSSNIHVCQQVWKCICCYSEDSARISISDLENIQETETPPQSPPPHVNEDVFIEMVRNSGTTTVKYSKVGSKAGRSADQTGERTEDDDSVTKATGGSPEVGAAFASVEHVSETPSRRGKSRKQPRKLVHYLDNETTDSSDQHSETHVKVKPERPVSVDMKVAEQLEEFHRGTEERGTSSSQGSQARRQINSPMAPGSSVDPGTNQGPETGKDLPASETGPRSESSKSVAQSESSKSSPQSETSREPEDGESGEEEKENTQTTSDAESGAERKESLKSGRGEWTTGAVFTTWITTHEPRPGSDPAQTLSKMFKTDNRRGTQIARRHLSSCRIARCSPMPNVPAVQPDDSLGPLPEGWAASVRIDGEEESDRLPAQYENDRPVCVVAPFFNSTNGRAHMYQPLSRTILHTLNSDESASRELRFPRYASSNCANAVSLSPLQQFITLQMESLQELEQASETVPKTMDYDEDEIGIIVEPQGLQELRDHGQTERKEVADDRESDEQAEVKRVAGCDVD